MKTLKVLLNFALMILAATILWGCSGAAGSSSGGSSNGSSSGTSSGTSNGSSGTNTGSSSSGGGTTPTPTPTPPTSTLGTYIKASNTDAGDRFGYSLAVSGDGNTMAIGAPLESSTASGINGNQADNNLSQAGAVYVYIHSTNGWTQQAYIKASNPTVREEFGLSVALSTDGNTLAVGTPLEDGSAKGVNGTQDNNASQAGAVYLFTRSGTAWTQQAYIKASNTETGDAFGTAVALSGDGNTLAVGASQEDSNATGVNGNQNDNSATDSGAVYVFTRAATVWTQASYIKASNTQSGDAFGSAVAISTDGNTLVVGALQEDSNATGVNGNQSDNSATDSGAVYIFTRSGVTWGQQAYVKSSNTEAGDSFGISVAVSGDGNTVLAGACCEDSNASGLNGNQTDNSSAGSGAAYLFTRSAGVWSQQFYIKAATNQAGEEFGHFLAISSDGNTIVAASARENSALNKPQTDQSLPRSGAVTVLTRNGSSWTYSGFLKAPNADAGDEFGSAVAVTANGSAVVIGADLEDGSATGINTNSGDNSAPDAGAAYVF